MKIFRRMNSTKLSEFLGGDLINPKHSDIWKVKILEPRPILFDKRLMEMIRTKNIE